MHLDKTLFLDKGQNYISRVLSDQPTIWNQGSSIFFLLHPMGHGLLLSLCILLIARSCIVSNEIYDDQRYH